MIYCNGEQLTVRDWEKLRMEVESLQLKHLIYEIDSAATARDVEIAVGKIHKLTDNAPPSERIVAEEAILRARQRVSALPPAQFAHSSAPQQGAGTTPQPSSAATLRAALWAAVTNDVDTIMLKDKAYGSSWKARGGVGAFMMLARKWDRIENQCKGVNYDVFKACADKTDGGILDDIRDLRAYLLLVETEVLK